MRFAFIEQHVDTFPVRLMCRVLEVSPSGFYAWRVAAGERTNSQGPAPAGQGAAAASAASWSLRQADEIMPDPLDGRLELGCRSHAAAPSAASRLPTAS